MKLVDLSQAGSAHVGSLVDCDVCVIGSGPAGLTIAQELSGSRLRVTLLESGGFERRTDTDALNEVESVGRPRVEDQWAVRNRMVGGSSHTWGGRCAAFDEIDFAERSWVPGSGWPLKLDDLVPYLERSAPYLGLSAGFGFSGDGFWALMKRRPRIDEFDPRLVLPFFWQFSRDNEDAYLYESMRFGRRIDRLGSNITLVTHATVVRINAIESGRAVHSVDFKGPDGTERQIRASTVVLCAGGIENARILLSSNTMNPNGLGNEKDLVGRYLMDHPRGAVGTFRLEGSEALQRRFGRYNVCGNLFRAGLRLSPQVQRDEGLLNCAAWLGETVASDDLLESIKRFARGKPVFPQDFISIAAKPGLVARSVYDYCVKRNGVPRKLDVLSLDCMCEQRPDPDSRVTLSDRRDRFGVPLSKIDWRIHTDESRTIRRMARLVAEQLVSRSLPSLDLAEWVNQETDLPLDFRDVGHPTGTTRMSIDPACGVVDANCQVHGVSGLYAAGSSVFPTAGHCNPTQMIVAMSLRLSDHLKTDAKKKSNGFVEVRGGRAVAPKIILVTGATGRIGRVVVSELLRAGYKVRATTSKNGSDHATSGRASEDSESLEWRYFNLGVSTGYDELVAGCAAVLHLGAEMAEPKAMWRSNVEATGLLAKAAEAAGVEAFCYTSSVAVYGSGLRRHITEDAPVLTADRDVRSEYWAVEQTRTYGRTKLGGELALRAASRRVRYVVLRPTIVVSADEIVDIRNWSWVKRVIAAHRPSNHIYVDDVSHALIWFMERALAGTGEKGVEIFNLSDDAHYDKTHADFMKKAYVASGDRRFRVPTAIWMVDWLREFLRFRSLPLRNPIWRMRFPNDRLMATGFDFQFGMEHARQRALDSIRAERRRENPATKSRLVSAFQSTGWRVRPRTR